jgi:hypothetical protein
MVEIRRGDTNKSRISRDALMIGAGVLGGIAACLIMTGLQPQDMDMQLGGVTSFESKPSLQSETSASISTPRGPKFIPEGFGMIYSYWGKFDHMSEKIPETWWLETSKKHKDNKSGDWFAQHAQDKAVAKFFNYKRDGYFVDLAANDAVWASNTFSLEQNFGWRGVCIEPNPMYWYRLSFRKCHVVGAIVGGTSNVEVEVALGQAHHGPFGGIIGDGAYLSI